MRAFRLSLAFMLALLLARDAGAAAKAPAPLHAGTARPLALVELFTSEGCSSCPPADALLVQLATRGDVIALSFHVTYWDRLGWRDPFSNETFTRRQGAYAHAFGLESLYTPQMVIDGRTQFVGSNRTAAADAIRDALMRPPGAGVSVRTRADGAAVAATVHVERATPDAVLFVAWADAERKSAPDRGENDGAHLRHVDVVRVLERVPLQGGRYDGVVHLTRPDAVAGSVVAWVQRGGGTPAEPGSGEVLGAQRALVPAR
jgi:hypothetical protein